MATLVKRGDRWRAQVRRVEQPPLSNTFGSKGDAAAWARDVESKIDRGHVEPGRKLTFSKVLSAYRREHVAAKGMGRSKAQLRAEDFHRRPGAGSPAAVIPLRRGPVAS